MTSLSDIEDRIAELEADLADMEDLTAGEIMACWGSFDTYESTKADIEAELDELRG